MTSPEFHRRNPDISEPGEGMVIVPSSGMHPLSRTASLLSSRSIATTGSRVSKRSARTQQSAMTEDNTSSDDDSSDDDQYTDLKTLAAQVDLPNDFWQVQKVVRYLKIGNQTATIIALCNLVDFDLKKDYCQLAIMDSGGLEVLANLLETDDYKCKLGSLRVLRLITVHPNIRRSVTLMGGIELMIGILAEPNQDLQLLATESLANLAKFKRARRVVRKHGGIPKLVDLLDVDTSKFISDSGDDKSSDSEEEEPEGVAPVDDDENLTLPIKVARGAAHALWALSKSKRNKAVIRRAGGLPLIAKLVKVRHTSILIPVIGTLQECASEKAYCLAIMQSEGMIADLVRNLGTESPKLKMLCASAIFRLAEEDDNRELVRLHGGLELLCSLLNDYDNQENKELMAAVTGAIWKCATNNPQNVERFEELELMNILIQLLRDNSDALDDLQFNPQKMSVLTNVVGAIAELSHTEANIERIKTEDGLVPLIKLINTNGPELLVNVSRALGECANNKDALERMRRQDGVRLLWSLLKHSSEQVQASAAWALSPCIRNAANAGDMVRSFVGGLELICSLLASVDPDVLAAVCYAIANIAKDKENLAVITDHGVINKLARLANTEVDGLRAKLAEAIANCCDWAGNRAMFGQSGAVAPLVNYLSSTDLEVHRSTSVALYQLSKDPWNCVTMHQNGVVPHLLRLIGSEDEEVQEASADCLQNIRKLALACEKFRYQHMKS